MADSGNGSFLGPVIALGPEGVVQFEVLVRGASGFEPAAKDADGFAPSSILGKCVRLTPGRDPQVSRWTRAQGVDERTN